METNKCKKCQQIIAGDIHRISITDTEVRSGKSNVKYENYCQSCYEKLPVGVRPYDCKGNDKCQSCGVAKECSSKKCNNSSCVDRISHICVDCWVKEWKKCVSCRQEKNLDANRLCSDCRVSNKEEWDGLLNCNYCSRRVKTLFTSSGQAGGDMCADCYAGKCKKCGSSTKGNPEGVCWKCITSQPVSVNSSISCNECKKTIAKGEECYIDNLNSYGSPYNICYCKPCGDKKKEEWERPSYLPGGPEWQESNKCPECGALGGCRGLCSMLRSRRNADEYREFTDWLNKNKIPELVAESKAENLKLVAEGKKSKQPFLVCQHCQSDISLWEYHKEINYQGDVDTEIAICHAKHVQNCQSASLSDRSKANAAFDKQNYDGFYFTDDKSGNKSRESGNPNNHQKGNGGLVKGILMVGLISSLIVVGIYALWKKKRRQR